MVRTWLRHLPLMGFLALALVPSLGWADGSSSTAFISAATAAGVNLNSTGITSHKITWNVTGTVSSCTVQLDSSADGVTWNSGDIIAGQTCTSNGTSALTLFTANFVRLHVTAFSGTGSVSVTWNGFVVAPPSTAGNNTFSGTNTFSGSTIFSKDPYYDARSQSVKCDGVTDDTAAFNAAFTSIKTTSRPATLYVYSPNGCLISGQLNSDGMQGVTIQGQSWNSIPGEGIGRNILHFTGTTGPLWSCSGCREVVIRGLFFWQSASTFTGVGLELGPTQSAGIKIEDNFFQFDSTQTGVVMVSLNGSEEGVIRESWFAANTTPTGTVYVRGAKDNTSFATVWSLENNVFNPGLANVNGHIAIQNMTQNFTAFHNTFEIGNGTGLIPFNVTAGAWTSALQVVGGHSWISNYVNDGGTNNTVTFFTYPAGCSGVSFVAMSISTVTANASAFNFGNNCKGVTLQNDFSAPGTVFGTYMTVGTGVIVQVSSNDWQNHTITTLLSGTPAAGSMVFDTSGNGNFYGPILTVNGSQSAPSYAFQGHAGDGMYSNGAGTLEFTVGGVQNFQMSSGTFDILANAGLIRFGGSVDTGISRSAANTLAIGNGITGNASGTLQVATVTAGTATNSKAYQTATNCAVNSVSPAACGSAASGVFVVPTLTTTYTVNTTAVTSSSRIFLQVISDNTGIPSSPTCAAIAITALTMVSGRTAGTSFTFSLPSTTGTTCFEYWVIN